MGYFGTLEQMMIRYLQDVTGLDTIGEQLFKALDQAMARQIIGVTGEGSSLVVVPDDLQATGIPTKRLFYVVTVPGLFLSGQAAVVGVETVPTLMPHTRQRMKTLRV